MHRAHLRADQPLDMATKTRRRYRPINDLDAEIL